MDDKLEHLLQELSGAIHEAVSASEQIRNVIAQIGGEGFEVLLFLNATIAILRGDETALSSRTHLNGKVRSGFNAEDVEFLKSMRISLKR